MVLLLILKVRHDLPVRHYKYFWGIGAFILNPAAGKYTGNRKKGLQISGRESDIYIPRGSTYTAMRELGPIVPSIVWYLGA